jgi:hypothetical protein
MELVKSHPSSRPAGGRPRKHESRFAVWGGSLNLHQQVELL